MANELAKYLNSRRRHQDENAVKRQVKIARQHGLTDRDLAIKEPHRMAKHNAMDCGQAGCHMCGNPRHTHKDGLTTQEKRMFQDVDHLRDTHSNGLTPDQEQND